MWLIQVRLLMSILNIPLQIKHNHISSCCPHIISHKTTGSHILQLYCLADTSHSPVSTTSLCTASFASEIRNLFQDIWSWSLVPSYANTFAPSSIGLYLPCSNVPLQIQHLSRFASLRPRYFQLLYIARVHSHVQYILQRLVPHILVLTNLIELRPFLV